MDIHIVEGPAAIPGSIRLEESIPSSLLEKERVINELLVAIESLGVVARPHDMFRYRLCLDEVIQNAIEHGNQNDESRRVRVLLFETTDRWGVVVSDEGGGFDRSEIPDNSGPEALLRESGRGIWILWEYMDGLSYFDGGRTAFLEKSKE